MKRTKLSDRVLPDYSKAEEIMNMVTHIVGGALGILVLTLCIVRAAVRGGWVDVMGAVIYGVSMITLYTMSSVYHGLRPGTAKKVMQVLDHCTIYFLIAGTYTPIVLTALRPVYPALAWGLFAFEWAMAALGATLNAVDLKKYRVFSMCCYIGMGWAVILSVGKVIERLGTAGFVYLLLGGVAFTVGAVLYGVGSKKHWMHSVFHIFVVIGTLLQFVAIYVYVL